jgi:mRNA interferase MazF
VAFEQWTVVVVPFPFTDRKTEQRRPAVVVSRPKEFGALCGHSVLAMVTSAAHRAWPLDVPITDLGAAGLPAPSLVRMKVFTLDDRLVERRAGTLAEADATKLAQTLAKLLGCG